MQAGVDEPADGAHGREPAAGSGTQSSAVPLLSPAASSAGNGEGAASSFPSEPPTRPYLNGDLYCFINATLQAMFASSGLKSLYWDLTNDANLNDDIEVADGSNDMCLARTYRLSSEAPRDRSMRPTLITSTFYHREQEEAH